MKLRKVSKVINEGNGIERFGRIETLIIDFIFDMALKDATLRNAYTGSSLSELRNNSGEARAAIKEYMDNVMLGYQTDFYETANTVKETLSNRAVFSFGNAQKLINMTAKYMFIKTYRNECLRNKFSVCHCPMDGIMVDVVISEAKDLDGAERSVLCESIESERFKNNRGWISLLRRPWSKMGDDLDSREQYELYQGIVRFLAEREDMIPIEFDYARWSAARE